MAIYRSIYTNFWTDTKVADEFTPEDRYFMLYCLTNNYTNLCGCFEISIKQISRDIGYDVESVEKLLKRFSEKHKIVFYNKKNKEMFIKNWNKYNWTKSEKLDKPLLKEIKNIKTIEFKRFLANEYNKRDTVSIPYQYTMDTTVSVTVSDTVKKEKPTLDDIQKYVSEKSLNVDAKQFYDYFEEGNWIDSKGNKVRNWKQKLLTWSKYSSSSKTETKKKYQDYEQREYDNLNKFYANEGG